MKIIEDSYSHYRHKNGLVHLNIKTTGSFSAVLIINTPALDDSGVSHAVEHFVFRRSQKFPQAETLFQLTALTDLKINASTLPHKTYYHCQSHCLESFLLGLKYLLAGLLTPSFVEDDLIEELTNHKGKGVIYRELTALNNDKVNRKFRQANLSDLSDERCYQYAGGCQMISTLTLEDLRQYHQEYYQSKKITLVTENIAPALIFDTIDKQIIPKENPHRQSQLEPGKGYQPKALPSVTHFHSECILLRYWLSSEFFSFIESLFDDLVNLLTPYELELVPLQQNLNKKHKFPLDIISVANDEKNQQQLSRLLQRYLSNHYQTFIGQLKPQQRIKAINHQQKFSLEINQLLKVYDEYELSKSKGISRPDSLQFRLGRVRVHKLALLNKPSMKISSPLDLMTVKRSKTEQSNRQWLAKSKKVSLIKPLASLHLELTSVDKVNNKVSQPNDFTVPNVIKGVFDKALEQFSSTSSLQLAAAYDENHCVISLKVTGENEALAVILSYIINAYPQFLFARIQGLCYLISAQYIKQHNCLVLFSAYDCAPTQRLTTIADALLALSQDEDFIKKSISLAKVKQQSLFETNAKILNEITVTTLTKFTLCTANKLISSFN